MFYSNYCPSYCFSCVGHESWSNNASNSASSYTFGLPLRSLSSMSNLPFLNLWNHSQQLLSLKAASPYVSTSNRCALAADFFQSKKQIKSLSCLTTVTFYIWQFQAKITGDANSRQTVETYLYTWYCFLHHTHIQGCIIYFCENDRITS